MPTRARYADESERLLQETSADAVVVVVLGGNKGHGHSMSMRQEGTSHFHAAMLRTIAGIFRRHAEAMEQEAQGIEASTKTMS